MGGTVSNHLITMRVWGKISAALGIPIRDVLTYRTPEVRAWMCITNCKSTAVEEKGLRPDPHEYRAAGKRQKEILGTDSSPTITVSKCSILNIISSSHRSFLSGTTSSPKSCKNSLSVIHSASTPSSPLTCHHL